MLNVVLILTLMAIFVFGFFVARAFGHFLDENRISGDEECTDVNDGGAYDHFRSRMPGEVEKKRKSSMIRCGLGGQ